MIDLSSNENPFPPADEVIKTVNSTLNQINRYVGYKETLKLRQAIAKYCNVSEERIIVGPGTNWINKEIMYNFGTEKYGVLFNPTFSNFLEKGRHIFKKIVRIQLTPPEFKVDWASITKDSSLVFIDSPNNPTGQCLVDRNQLLDLLENKNCLVVIDEAGFEYSGITFVDLVQNHSNLAITRTFDKAFALAGLRISYLIAGDDFLKKLSPEDSLVDLLGCVAVSAALEELEYMKRHVSKTIEERQFLKESLTSLGFEVCNSRANYLLVKTAIPDLAIKLFNSGILIEDLSKTWLANFYRITIGKREEHLELINIIKGGI